VIEERKLREAREREVLGGVTYERLHETAREKLAESARGDWLHEPGSRWPVKVFAIGNREPHLELKGSFADGADLIGQTPDEIERILGLRPTTLASGAMIEEFAEPPRKDQFVSRGFTSKPRGEPPVEGSEYPPGELRTIRQYELTEPVQAKSGATVYLQAGERYARSLVAELDAMRADQNEGRSQDELEQRQLR
jgi:hypothetical protein